MTRGPAMISVQTDRPFEILCRECRGVGFLSYERRSRRPSGPAWCQECGGTGAEFLDLACLFLNLAIVGAIAGQTLRLMDAWAPRIVLPSS